MIVLISAKNVMGDVAEYEVEVDNLVELQAAIDRLYSRPGIVQVTLPSQTIKELEQWADQWEGFDNT